LKVKFADFHQITRSHTGVSHIATQAELERLGLALLGPIFPARRGIRLLGVALSSLGEERLNSGDQLNLKF
jgi:DNA polymerase-4